MCAQYMINSDLRKLERFGIRVPNQIGEYTDRIVPHRLAPVVILENGEMVLREMQFALLPAWSKEARVKFATHNARLETIDSKPTWKRPFEKTRCLVPMTDFIEPIYEGEYAGYMVGFHAKGRTIMVAAGIWDRWVDRSTGEVIESFAVITDDPVPFVRERGHDRMPVFLGKENWTLWLSEGASTKERKALLATKPQHFDLDIYKDRPMRPGWEKRK